MTRISNSLESVAAFDASLPEVVDSLGAFLGRFGEVKREERQGFEGVLGWLLPLTSFASRYVVLSWTQEWTIVLKNARELAAVDKVNVVSRRAECRAVHARWSAGGCLWRVLDSGKETRTVICNDEGDGWSWHEEGEPLPFEDLSLYRRRRKRDRLPASAVYSYLTAFTGAIAPPDWRELMSGDAMYLERSLENLRGPVDLYSVDLDI